jgi:hypothetical protein
VAAAVLIFRGAAKAPKEAVMLPAERANWRMPALALLQRPQWSMGRRVAILALRGYLVVAVLLLIVKAVQIALGHR